MKLLVHKNAQNLLKMFMIMIISSAVMSFCQALNRNERESPTGEKRPNDAVIAELMTKFAFVKETAETKTLGQNLHFLLMENETDKPLIVITGDTGEHLLTHYELMNDLYSAGFSVISVGASFHGSSDHEKSRLATASPLVAEERFFQAARFAKELIPAKKIKYLGFGSGVFWALNLALTDHRFEKQNAFILGHLSSKSNGYGEIVEAANKRPFFLRGFPVSEERWNRIKAPISHVRSMAAKEILKRHPELMSEPLDHEWFRRWGTWSDGFGSRLKKLRYFERDFDPSAEGEKVISVIYDDLPPGEVMLSSIYANDQEYEKNMKIILTALSNGD